MRILGCRFVFRVGMPGTARVALVNEMADVEQRLSAGTSERLQLGSLVAAFAKHVPLLWQLPSSHLQPVERI